MIPSIHLTHLLNSTSGVAKNFQWGGGGAQNTEGKEGRENL